MAAKREFDRKRYIECALELIPIGTWQIDLGEADHIDDNDLAAGICSTNTRYRYSEIVVSTDTTDEDEVRSVLLHEVLHIVHAPIDHAVQARIIGDNFSGKYRKIARLNETYLDAMEPFIVQLTEVLRPFVDAMYDKPQPTKKKVTKPNE